MSAAPLIRPPPNSNTVIDDRSRLLSIPRRLLDPRRPVGILSKMDKEEMLVPYEVMLPFDPRRVISHEVEVSDATYGGRSKLKLLI